MQGIAIKYIINTFLSNFPWLNSSGSPKIAKKFMKFFFMANITSELFPSFRKSHPQVFLGKGVLKAFSKHTGEHPCQSVISIKLQSNFIEIILLHGCSPVNLLHNFRRKCFTKDTCGLLLLCFGVEVFSASKWENT